MNFDPSVFKSFRATFGAVARLRAAFVEWKVNHFPTLRISRSRWGLIWLLGTIIGVCAYYVIISLSYASAERTMRSAGPDFLLSWPTTTAERIAEAIMGQFSLNNKNVKDSLTKAVASYQASLAENLKQPLPPPGKLSISEIVDHLMADRRTGACQKCDSSCSNYVRPSVVRLLLGWPGQLNSEVDALQGTINASIKEATPDAIARACATLDRLSNRSPWLGGHFIVGRADPVPAPLVAQLLVGPGTCVPSASQDDRDLCLLVTRLFQSILDNSSVRQARALGVNFFYGPERLAVFILGFVTLLALLHQQAARTRLTAQEDWVLVQLDAIDGKSSSRRTTRAKQMRDDFLAKFFPQLREQPEESSDVDDLTKRYREEQEPVRDLVNAVSEAISQKDPDYLKSFVELNLNEIEAARETLNTIITIFPVVGFGATLISLVKALAGANQIATSTGDWRSSAILEITEQLSSSFATTFLALMLMAIFAVLNFAGGSAERRLVTSLQERMLTVFRPKAE